MTNKKIKVLTICDMPISTSGVANQARYMIEALIKSQKFSIISLGGAVKHQDYNPLKIDPYGEDWLCYPVDGFGTPEMIRSVIRTHRPDILWFMTDPRFWGHLWKISDEIRPLMPMIYYHVWDNLPAPKYNFAPYDCNDLIVTISKLTNEVVKSVTPHVDCTHLPHAIDTDIFKPLPEEQVKTSKQKSFNWSKDKFLVFWNNRNARRKQPGTLLWCWRKFLDRVGPENATLLMHTEPNDEHGPNLQAIIHDFDMLNGEVLFSRAKVPPHILAELYNMADITVNISDAEGFGLSTLESLSCGTPIVVNKTGGLQEQITDGKNTFGVGIESKSKSLVGSQAVPYIFEDRFLNEDFIDALEKMYNMTKEERENLGKLGREHVEKNYNFENYNKNWIDLMLSVHEKHGSWETRKGYKAWSVDKI
jgi:glycosyltransferase involved in cell wall biosynthesis